MADHLVNNVIYTCQAALQQRKSPPHHKRPAYWWNSEIASLRRTCIQKRRIATRARHTQNPDLTENAHDDYRDARRNLRNAIKASKSQSWSNLCKEVDDNPWGRPYKIVMGKLKGATASRSMDPTTLDSVVCHLFPQHPNLTDIWTSALTGQEVPSVTSSLVSDVLEYDKKKAPGPDGIPKKIWQLVHKWDDKLLPNLFDKCLNEGNFPRRWKESILVLITKPSRPVNSPSSFRPLCLLDDAGKLLERIIADQLTTFLTSSRGLSRNQHGFTKGRSTVTALQQLTSIADSARNSRQLLLAVSLDVKNAFNSISWKEILGAMVRRQVPAYLTNIIRSYFSERKITAESSSSKMQWPVSSGVPQGSVIGPLLWNIAFDDLLKLSMPNGVELICYADDTLVTVCGKTTADIETSATVALKLVSRWMTQKGLELAVTKTEAIFFRGRRRKVSPPSISFGNTQIIPSPTMLYLGVLLDNRLSFQPHLKRTKDKATTAATHLSRLMPNLGGPKEDKRRLLMSVITSILTYASPIWESSLQVKKNELTLRESQRKAAQRCISSYRTVSFVAATALAGIPPIDLLLQERKHVKELIDTGNSKDSAVTRARKETLRKWQQRWLEPEPRLQGAWTKTLIPKLDQWVDRPHGQLSYRLTQLLTGHGSFQQYLHRFGITDSPICLHCPLGEDDTAYHTIFICPAWQTERSQLSSVIGPVNTTEPVARMIVNRTCWNAVATFAEAVLVSKEAAARDRERHAATGRVNCP